MLTYRKMNDENGGPVGKKTRTGERERVFYDIKIEKEKKRK